MCWSPGPPASALAALPGPGRAGATEGRSKPQQLVPSLQTLRAVGSPPPHPVPPCALNSSSRERPGVCRACGRRAGTAAVVNPLALNQPGSCQRGFDYTSNRGLGTGAVCDLVLRGAEVSRVHPPPSPCAEVTRSAAGQGAPSACTQHCPVGARPGLGVGSKDMKDLASHCHPCSLSAHDQVGHTGALRCTLPAGPRAQPGCFTANLAGGHSGSAGAEG